MKKNNMIYLIFCLSLLFGKNVQAQEVIDEIVAIVDREVILLSELKLQTQYLALELKIDPTEEPDRFKLLLDEVLKTLIDNKVLLAKAVEDSILVSDQEIDQMLEGRIAQLINQYGSEEEVEKRIGNPVASIKKLYREEMRNREMIRRLQTQRQEKVSITPGEVEKFYEVMKDSLPEVPEQYHVSHILLEVKPGGDVVDAAHRKIDSLRTRILAGEDFSRLAELYSDDKGNARDGGRLGALKRGDLGIQEFEEALFTLKPGMVSDVIMTPLGFHIIKALEQRGERMDAQHILVSLSPTKADEQRVIEELWDLKRRAEAGEDFSQLSLTHSNDPEVNDNKGDLGWLRLDQITLPQFKKVIPPLKPGEVSAPFKTNFGYHILHLSALKPKHRFSLDEDRETIKQMALNQKGMKEYQEWLQEVRTNTFIQIKQGS